MNIYLLMILIFGLSLLVSMRLKSKIAKYSKIELPNGLSGKEIAELMLANNNIDDVEVMSVSGQLTDHYNPAKHTVNLSPDVYNGRSIASAAIAAHECGHAVQHANSYSFLRLRSALVPAVSFTSRYVQWVLLAGIILIQVTPAILTVGIAMLALATLFSFVTLPVEINASHRALVWLRNSGLTDNNTADYARDALKWAAMTYVVAAIGSLATLLYYLNIRRD